MSVLLVLVAAWSGPASAMLAPQYERARVLGAIAEAVAAVVADPVTAIEEIGEDRFRVHVGACAIEAYIRTKTELGGPPAVGPRRFEVLLDQPKC